MPSFLAKGHMLVLLHAHRVALGNPGSVLPCGASFISKQLLFYQECTLQSHLHEDELGTAIHTNGDSRVL